MAGHRLGALEGGGGGGLRGGRVQGGTARTVGLSGVYWKGRDRRGSGRGGRQAVGGCWRMLAKWLGAVTVGYGCDWGQLLSVTTAVEALLKRLASGGQWLGIGWAPWRGGGD